MVLEFEHETPQETIDWVLNKLTAHQNSGGGQLLAIPTEIDGDGKKVKARVDANPFVDADSNPRILKMHD